MSKLHVALKRLIKFSSRFANGHGCFNSPLRGALSLRTIRRICRESQNIHSHCFALLLDPLQKLQHFRPEEEP